MTARGEWPNLFVVGAAKAGTTALHRALAGHPAVHMSPVKEPHFLADVADPPPETPRPPVRSEAEYLALFAEAGSLRWRGEASPSYLFDPRTPARIQEIAREPRIVISLRDPVERAHSHYLMDRTSGLQQRSFLDALREDERQPSRVWYAAHLYVDLGLYLEQVRRYLDAFGTERVLVLFFDELLAGGVAPCARSQTSCTLMPRRWVRTLPVSNRYREMRLPERSGLVRSGHLRKLARAALPARVRRWGDRVLFRPAAKPPVPEHARAYLAERYRPQIPELEELLGRELPWRRAWD